MGNAGFIYHQPYQVVPGHALEDGELNKQGPRCRGAGLVILQHVWNEHETCSRSPKVGNPIVSLSPKSNVSAIPAPIIFNPVFNFLGFAIKTGFAGVFVVVTSYLSN